MDEKVYIVRLGKGFTLIELMVVVSIIAILAFIAVPSYQQSVRKSCRNDARHAILEIASLQEKFYFQANQYSTDLSFSDGGLNYSDAEESSEGCYVMAVVDCSTGGDSMSCYRITATTIGVQALDSSCKTLSMDSSGKKAALDDSSVDATAVCW